MSTRGIGKKLRHLELLLKEAEGQTHTNIREYLQELASEWGYRTSVCGWDSEAYGIPDVVRSMVRRRRRHLFVGEAKDSENENCRKKATASRVRKYFSGINYALQTGVVDYDYVLGTNTRKEATAWRRWLIMTAIQETSRERNFYVERVPEERMWLVISE